MAFFLIGVDLRDINTNKNNTIIYGKRQKERVNKDSYGEVKTRRQTD